MHKLLAIVAVAIAPALAHAQGTQDTTAMGHTKSKMDSTTQMPKMNSSTKMHDTTAMGHNMTHKDSMSMSSKMKHKNSGMKHDSTSMSVSPADSAKMGMTKTPPR